MRIFQKRVCSCPCTDRTAVVFGADTRRRYRYVIRGLPKPGCKWPLLIPVHLGCYQLIRAIARARRFRACAVISVGAEGVALGGWLLARLLLRCPFVIRLGGNCISVPEDLARYHRARFDYFRAALHLTRSKINRFLLRRADQIVVVADILGKELSEAAAINKHKIKVIPPLRWLKRSRIKKARLTRELRLVCVTNLSLPEKANGVKTLVQEIDLAAQKLKRALRLDIYGGGQCAEEIIAFLHDRQSGNNVRIGYHGWDPAVRRRLQSADVFCYWSTCDGLPNVILEALSSGLPLIVNDHPVFHALVFQGVNGYLINDKLTLATALEQLSEPTLRMSMSRESLAILDARYSPESINQKWRNLLNDH